MTLVRERRIYQIYLLHNAAMELAFSSPKWLANSFAILSVERSVPYKSNAMTILLSEAIMSNEDVDKL